MYAHFYAGMQWTNLPVFALLLFMVTFLGAIVRVSRKARRAQLDAAARLPFDENERVDISRGDRT